MELISSGLQYSRPSLLSLTHPSPTHMHVHTFMPSCLYSRSLSCPPSLCLHVSMFLSCLCHLSVPSSPYPPLSLRLISLPLCSRQAFLTFCFAVTFHLCAWLILLNKLQSKQICPSSPLSLFSPSSSLRRLLWFTEETLQSKYSLGISCINMPDFLSPGGEKNENAKKLCVTVIQYVTTNKWFDALVGAVWSS